MLALCFDLNRLVNVIGLRYTYAPTKMTMYIYILTQTINMYLDNIIILGHELGLGLVRRLPPS